MSSVRHIKCLLVDDDEDDLYLINDALQEVQGARYHVKTAPSALTAMAELAKAHFDVIFSDYRLGPVTGIDFIRSVRTAGIDTPIILLTGIADSVIDDAALKAGSSDFVPKIAITGDVLDRSVRYAIAHAERQRLLLAVLRSTISGVAVLDSQSVPTLWNPRFIDFAQHAFGEEQDRILRLAQLARLSESKDIVLGNKIVEAHISALPDGGSVLALHDVTERVNDLNERERAEQRIRKIAMEDTLTGLPNRMAFNDYLDNCLLKAASENQRVAVLSFDFNRFKEVNDLFGHAAGDELLKTVAPRLKTVLSDNEYVARLGGDEFVLVQTNANDASALDLARRIATSMRFPVEWETRVIEPSISVGIALFPEHGSAREELLANADLAMYRGKSEEEQPVSLFDISMDQFVRDRRKLAHELKRAIHNEELSLQFQAQYAGKSQKLLGFEVLLRWHSPSRGNVPPGEFIPVAEETGLINEIDEWVLRQACKLLSECPEIPRFAVNVSAKAIGLNSIVPAVRSALIETGISPDRLELEVTETALINDLNRGLHNLRQLKALGLSIALDDFGTGYSSLSLLNSFPFDRIKIDKSFISMADVNTRAAAIFKTVIGLGQALGVPVLVEGVEDSAQLSLAVMSGCEEVQGFLFGLPLAYDELQAVVEYGLAEASFPDLDMVCTALRPKALRA